MRIPRVFISLPSELSASELKLGIEDARHVVRVLRLTPGRPLIAVDRSSGKQFKAELVTSEPAAIKIIEPYGEPLTATACQGLLFALCRGGRNEFVVEKATELGAREIHLFQSERSTAKIKSEDIESKTARFLKVAEAAAKQCRRTDIPDIFLSSSLPDAMDRLPAQPSELSTYFYLSPSPEALHPTKIKPPPHPVHLLVGPEGGLSSSEERAVYERGFRPLSLGERILRAETAAVAALAIAQTLWR